MIAFRPAPIGVGLAAATLVAGCSVKLQAPDEPIRFDVNVNITEQKRVEIDQELLALIRRNPALFGFEEGDLPESSGAIERQ